MASSGGLNEWSKDQSRVRLSGRDGSITGGPIDCTRRDGEGPRWTSTTRAPKRMGLGCAYQHLRYVQTSPISPPSRRGRGNSSSLHDSQASGGSEGERYACVVSSDQEES